MYYKNNPKFPKGFMWGASSSAWQVEGGTSEGGRTPAMIDLNSKKKKPYADNSVCADHFHRFKEDVALMAECGFTSYRFSLAWPRIIPNSDGKVNPEGIAFYNDLINELIKNNITPIVTLYHYDLPVWVFEELGGWRSRKTVDAFEHYAKVCFEHFGDRVKYWLSINEQNMQIVYGHWLGTSAGCDDWEKDQWDINHIMNLCHAKSVIACHEMVEGGMIGPVPGYVPIYPKTCNPLDQIAAMNAEELTEKIWNDTYYYGEYSGFVKKYWEEHDIHPDIRPDDIELMKKAKIDYIAVNCYRSNVAYDAKPCEERKEYELNKYGIKGELQFPYYPGEFAMDYNQYVEYTDWDWEIDPTALRYSLRYLWDHYRLPMMITENGFGANEVKDANGEINDQYRINYLRDQIYNVGLAIEDGCEIIAYNPWSFTDLLSTGNGIKKRYGLVYIDTTDDELVNCEDVSKLEMKRIKKASFHWYSKLIKSNGTEWGKEMEIGNYGKKD